MHIPLTIATALANLEHDIATVLKDQLNKVTTDIHSEALKSEIKNKETEHSSSTGLLANSRTFQTMMDLSGLLAFSKMTVPMVISLSFIVYHGAGRYLLSNFRILNNCLPACPLRKFTFSTSSLSFSPLILTITRSISPYLSIKSLIESSRCDNFAFSPEISTSSDAFFLRL